MSRFKKFLLNEGDELKYFAPKTWFFWRSVIINFFLFSVIGHWMEIPYCSFMDVTFHIVEPDYAIWTDPWYMPYWVYGIGATIITLVLLPLKIHILTKRKTIWGAILEYFVIAVVLCAAMELIIGLIINQPDPITGKHPFWNNSTLPGNILGQAWIVNDLLLGVISLIYVWLIFPFLQKFYSIIGEKVSNVIFACVILLFIVICLVSYMLPFFTDMPITKSMSLTPLQQ